MLNLILGTSGTGKSNYIKRKILENASNGIRSLLIVPEQFSKTAETEIFSSLEKNCLSKVDVHSFTSLLEDVMQQQGKKMPNLLDDAAKAVIARKSLQNVQNQLNFYDRQIKNTQFSFQVAKIFEDFKRNGIKSENLYEIAQNVPKTNSKLKDIAIAYSQYCSEMKESYTDIEQMYEQLAMNLPEQYTDNVDVFIDSFEKFTHGQYCIIQRLMQKSKNVYVALITDEVFDVSNETYPLSYTSSTAKMLISIAQKSSVKVAPIIKMCEKHRFVNKDLADIGNFILGKDLEYGKCKNAYVTVFDNQFKEISYVTARINTLVKNGYKYNDIAVVCPQLDKYEHQIQESFLLAKIPYFIDQNRIITSSAPVVVIKNILEIMDNGVNSNTVIPLLKTSLTHFDEDVINFTENYSFVWQDSDISWQQPFTLPYQGIVSKQADDDVKILNKINELREKIVEIFSVCENNDKCTADNILKKMYSILTQLSVEQMLAEKIKQTSDKTQADLISRQWDAAIGCVEQLYNICGQTVMTAKELKDFFMLMISGTEIGFAPQTQDCVLVSNPVRIKVQDIKVVFVVGASQDVFPSIITETGILSADDIQYLKENQMEISSNFSQRFAFENLYFYKTLTTARELLFISTSKRNIDSQDMLSADIESIKENLSLQNDALSLEDYCITPEFFTQYLGELQLKDKQRILQQVNIDVQKIQERNFAVENLDNILKITGEHMLVSPTSAENYYKCAFGYFLRNILKIYPLEKAQITQRHAGNYLHIVAQNVLEKYKHDYCNANWQEIEEFANDIVSDYIEKNYPEQVRNTARFKALSTDMFENALQLLKYIYSEQNHSQFRPVAFEQKIGFDCRIKPVTIDLDNEKKVSVIGVCDRIDIMQHNSNSYVRIVDYKIGTQKFSLEDVYNGLSNQLLLYMQSVVSTKDFASNMVPAAVMYQPSDVAYKFDSDTKLYTPTGMVLENQDVCAGFDKNCSGEFGLIKGDEKLKSVEGSEMVSQEMFDAVLQHSKDKIKEMAQGVMSGKFDNLPMEIQNGKTSCEYCGYRCICQEFDRCKPKQKANFVIKEKKDG